MEAILELMMVVEEMYPGVGAVTIAGSFLGDNDDNDNEDMGIDFDATRVHHHREGHLGVGRGNGERRQDRPKEHTDVYGELTGNLYPEYILIRTTMYREEVDKLADLLRPLWWRPYFSQVGDAPNTSGNSRCAGRALSLKSAICLLGGMLWKTGDYNT